MPTWNRYFFSYPAVKEIDDIVKSFILHNVPEYDFVAADGIGHHFWVIKDKGIIMSLIELFDQIPFTYVADGHHRTAAAALVGKEKREKNPKHTGKRGIQFLFSCSFP